MENLIVTCEILKYKALNFFSQKLDQEGLLCELEEV